MWPILKGRVNALRYPEYAKPTPRLTKPRKTAKKCLKCMSHRVAEVVCSLPLQRAYQCANCKTIWYEVK